MFNLTRFLPRRKPASVEADSLDAFFTEAAPPGPGRESRLSPQTFTPTGPFLAAVVIVALIGTALGGLYTLKKAAPVSAAPAASLTIESDPAGAEVSAGGASKGVTPLTLSVAPGEHTFEIVHAERRKQIRVTARAEAAVVHHVQFDLPTEPPVAPSPPKAAAPSAVATSGSSAPAGPVAGWLAITSPIPLTIMEGDQVIGSTAAAKLMLPAGKRTLRLVNAGLGFSERRTVQVGPGKTATLSITVPKAPLSINAVPWAEVWIDGVRVGETPIGNHMVRIGAHDIVFRHPTLGERHQSATVSLTAPARVSVDMRKDQ